MSKTAAAPEQPRRTITTQPAGKRPHPDLVARVDPYREHLMQALETAPADDVTRAEKAMRRVLSKAMAAASAFMTDDRDLMQVEWMNKPASKRKTKMPGGPQSLPPRLCPEILDSLLSNAKPEPELKAAKKARTKKARDVRQQQLKLD